MTGSKKTMPQGNREIIAEHRYLKRILDSSPVPMLVVDSKGICTHWNPACESLFGIAAEQIVGTNRCWQAFYDEPRPILAQLIAQGETEKIALHYDDQRPAAQQNGAIEVEAYFPKLDRWLFFTATPLFGDKGQLIGAMETLQDVTARKRAEAEREEARKIAEAASCAKSQFLAHMSHEIRTPLNGVIGLAQLGLAQCEGRHAYGVFEKIRQSGEHLRDLINDILDFSKIEAGKIELEQSTFPLTAVIDRTVALTALQARQKGIEFVVDEAPDLPLLWSGDQLRLTQCLVNLLSNATKFTEQGAVCFRIFVVNGDLVFSILDSGIGMSQMQLDSLFSPFTQAEAAISRKFGGTGLGLAITRELTEHMGGRISVRSDPGCGSEFQLIFPLPGGVCADKRVPDGLPEELLLHGLGAKEGETVRRSLEQLGVACTVLPATDPAFECSQKCLLLGSDTLPLWLPLLRHDQYVVLAVPPGTTPSIPEGLYGRVHLWQQPLRLHQLSSVLVSSATQADQSKTESQRLLGYRALVVDDNWVNLMVVEGLLEIEGAETECVTSGAQALETLERLGPSHFSLVISDVQMPEMDGFRLTREIHQRMPEVKVIGLSANATEADLARAREAGMLAYLTKPIDPELLVKTLGAICGNQPGNVEVAVQPDVDRVQTPSTVDHPPGLVNFEMLLQQFQGNAVFVNKLLDAALSGNRELADEIRRYAATHDFEALERLAHRARGVAGNLRAKVVQEQAAAVESQARVKNPEVFPGAEKLADQIQVLQGELSAYLATMQ